MKNQTLKFISNPKFWLPLIFLLVAAGFNFVGSQFIATYFPDRNVPTDLLFRATPYVAWTQYLTDIANIASFILALVYILRYELKFIGYYLLEFGVAYFVRAILIVLTPFGGYFGNQNHYGLTTIQQHGCFPSGHTLMVVLAYFIIAQGDNRMLKLLAFASIIIEVVSLILSRGHYSIDIAGGFLVAYFAFNYLKKYQSRLEI